MWWEISEGKPPGWETHWKEAKTCSVLPMLAKASLRGLPHPLGGDPVMLSLLPPLNQLGGDLCERRI